MSTEIKDGTGTGNKARVDKTNRFTVHAVVQDEESEAAEDGNAFFIGSGFINLTTGNESAILFIQNNEEQDLKIVNIIFSSRPSIGGTQTQYAATFIKNPSGMSAGTGNSAAITNINFGSAKNLSSSTEIGVEAATLTNGSVAAEFIIEHGKLDDFDAALVLPRGSSIGVKITPPSGNTSLDVEVAFRTFLERAS